MSMIAKRSAKFIEPVVDDCHPARKCSGHSVRQIRLKTISTGSGALEVNSVVFSTMDRVGMSSAEGGIRKCS